ncbi:HD domain-containing protein [Paenibacillus filicis]|uniref:HD domain-containing protein n=2 Tax=Paenibacillus gyeongsangnamensis TaxID=3388067 RepID=A0ABT4QFQ5_9BACL|nr:HD domain-containing protein [Paenibacillus filicis]MCZ8515709.1 HD domain-containing protein [Paenibacillus filicis]
MKDVLEQAKSFAKVELGGDSSGHDWWHVARVAAMAVKLAQLEGADAAVCELAALLHDVADEKLNESKEAGLAKVEGWLLRQGVEASVWSHVLDIISTMSYGGGGGQPMRTLEGRIVQDADRLDALGAVGIARTFAYSGWKGQAMHDPELAVRETMTAEEYRKGKSTAVNHFYEKLLKLKDLMNTEAARAVAEERHMVMERFLKAFYAEWSAEDADFMASAEDKR